MTKVCIKTSIFAFNLLLLFLTRQKGKYCLHWLFTSENQFSMEIIKYEASGFLPGVILNKETGEMKFSGRACPEDPVEFYKPIFDWIDGYSENPNEKTC